MELSYSSRFEGILTANFAAVQDGVVLYPDLVKVQVSLADGTVIGLEAANYLMNHVNRALALPKLTEADAIGRIGGALTPVSARLCVIPENEAEFLCYEVRATSGADTFLAYIDAETGVERRLMQVISDEGGAKVM
jgi:germination protein YpeB